MRCSSGGEDPKRKRLGRKCRKHFLSESAFLAFYNRFLSDKGLCLCASLHPLSKKRVDRLTNYRLHTGEGFKAMGLCASMYEIRVGIEAILPVAVGGRQF
jgi:hypothetical protein